MAKLTTVEPVPLMWPGEGDLRDRLLSYTKKYGDANKNLENLTPQEKEALGFLDLYGDATPGGSPYNEAAGQEILKTLRGGYDPQSSDFYAPVVRGIEQRRDQAQDRLRRSFQIGGNLSSLSRARAEAMSDTEYEGQIAQMMLGLQENERGRMLSVIPGAMNLGEYVEEGPLRKAQAYREIGSIPRDLETQSVELGQGILTGYRPTYYNPMDFSYMDASKSKKNLGAGIGGLAGGALGAFMGGPAGAAAGYSMGSSLGGYFG